MDESLMNDYLSINAVLGNGYKIEYIVCMVFNQIRGIENA